MKGKIGHEKNQLLFHKNRGRALCISSAMLGFWSNRCNKHIASGQHAIHNWMNTGWINTKTPIFLRGANASMIKVLK